MEVSYENQYGKVSELPKTKVLSDGAGMEFYFAGVSFSGAEKQVAAEKPPDIRREGVRDE